MAMSAHADKYAELMAPAFTEALASIDAPLDEGRAPIVGMANCQMLVRPVLEAVDWESAGLPDQPRNDGPDLTPQQYSERLMAYAFGDAYDVIYVCEQFVEQHGLPHDVSIGDLLINGAKQLMAVSRLKDGPKGRLMEVVKNPSLSEFMRDVPDVTNPIRLVSDEAGQRFEWSEAITKWLEENRSTGCPAHAQTVETSHGRISSVYYFYEQLVRAMYPTSH